MIKIDTNTDAGKIEIMQSNFTGKPVERRYKGDPMVYSWVERRPKSVCWDWDKFDYRLIPQTVEEAANEYLKKKYSVLLRSEEVIKVIKDFKAGAEFQKEQDNE